jgi:perosamine synthetase
MGYNFKFTDLQAVIGIEQMKKLAWRLRRKKEMFALYRSELAGAPGIRFIDTNLSEVAPWFMDILVENREALGRHLAECGIKTRPFYPPVHSQPAYGWGGSYPVTEDVASRGLWLPSSTFLTDDDLRHICERIRACVP